MPIDLIDLRQRLNELPFHHGKRSVPLGPLEDVDLDRLRRELAEHDLQLVRGEDELFVEQSLRRRAVDLSWLGVGFEWAYRIMSIGLMMFLPGLVGRWLDHRLETSFLTPIGFAFGLAAAGWQLVRIAAAQRAESGK